MKCRTHIVAANALSLMILNPAGIVPTITVMAGASLGGATPDLDANDMHKKSDYLFGLAGLTFIAFILLDMYMNWNIFDDPYLSILGAVLYMIIGFIGKHKAHRSILHSLMSLIVLGGIVYMSFNMIFWPFVIGYISHILLDILNIRPVRVFYPLKKGISLKISRFDGLLNSFIFYSSILIIVICIIF